MYQLGGSRGAPHHAATRQLGRGEPIEDSAQVISRMVDIVMIRTFEQDKHRALRRALARAGDQRPDQRIPPVPDPGRHLHLHRAPRLDRGQASSRGSATATTWPTPGCRPPRSSASRVHVSARRSGYEVDQARGRRPQQRQLQGLRRPDGSLRAAPTWSPPTCGPAWASRPRTRSAARPSPTGASTRDMMARRQARRALHALPARAPRRGSRGRGDRRPADRWCGTRPRTACTCRRR